MKKTVIFHHEKLHIQANTISPTTYFRICTNVYTPYSIGCINSIDLNILLNLTNLTNLAIKNKFLVILNGSNDRKEHNYQWWITSKIHSHDYYWSYGSRQGTKIALLLKPRYFHHWYSV
jgi:hypothetical protein